MTGRASRRALVAIVATLEFALVTRIAAAVRTTLPGTGLPADGSPRPIRETAASTSSAFSAFSVST
ncbi:MAG: hypothetical protein ABWX56_07150 [Mycetocola sp.]